MVPLAPQRLLHPREVRPVAPLVELAPQGVRLGGERADLARGDEAVSPGGVDVGDGGVDDAGFGGAPDLGEVGEEGGEVLGAPRGRDSGGERGWADEWVKGGREVAR
jgi:hypothetical protein